MGLDRPIWIQYGLWGRNVLRGDLGRSWVSHQTALAPRSAASCRPPLQLTLSPS